MCPFWRMACFSQVVFSMRGPHMRALCLRNWWRNRKERTLPLLLYISLCIISYIAMSPMLVTHTLLWASTSRVYCSPLPSHYQKGQKEFLLTVSWLQLQVLKLTKEKIICINEGYRFTWQQIHSAWILWNVLLTVKIIDISILGVNHNFCKSQIIILHTNFREQLIFV